MPRRPDTPCAGCGRLMWRSSTNLPPGEARCRECRHSYRRGCRCEDCKASNAARSRGYRRSFRARTGRSLSSEYRHDGGTWIGEGRRLAIYERDGWACQLCGDPIDRDADPMVGGLAPSLDHIVPRSLGGGDDDDNLRMAHRDCNARRGARVAA